MKKCGIINYWWSPVDGHGASLTAYALYKVVEEVGNGEIMPVLIKTVYGVTETESEHGRHFSFFKNKVNYTDKNYLSKEDYETLSDDFDIILLGSDQVFRLEWVPAEWFLYDVGDTVKKIAVSASFGINKINGSEEKKQRAIEGLRSFNQISVREQDAVKVFNSFFYKNENIQVLTDPVFWTSVSVFDKLLKEHKFSYKKNKKNIFLCVLDENEFINSIIQKYSCQGYEIYMDNESIDASDFLYMVKEADYIITDSYHTMCFSIIYNKEFIGLSNTMRGSSRINELKRLFHIDNVLYDMDISNIDNLEFNKIDYEHINKSIFEEAKRAREWICRAITETD